MFHNPVIIKDTMEIVGRLLFESGKRSCHKLDFIGFQTFPCDECILRNQNVLSISWIHPASTLRFVLLPWQVHGQSQYFENVVGHNQHVHTMFVGRVSY